MAEDVRHRTFKSMLEELPPREGFQMNYQIARIDRNALYALNTVFPPESIAAVRAQYHRAALKFEDLRADLLEFGCPKPSRHVEPSYYAVLESVRQDLKLYNKKVIPLTTGAIAKHKDFPGPKSPGIPYKIQGYPTKRDAVNDPAVLQEIRQMWYDIESGKDVELPDVACYARAQICTRDKNKVRATWGYPLAVYMAEAAYFYPILDALKDQDNPFIAYGLEMANGGMTYIDSMAQAFPGYPYLMGDWSKFDKTIPAWLIRDAFKILTECIDFTRVQDADGKIWRVREHRSRRRWRRLISYFIDTPIRMSDGTRYQKHSGVPSGTCFTNVIDSIVNMIVMRYIVYEFTGSLPIHDLYLGDDSVVVLPKMIDLTKLSEFALDQFGMIFNPDKSYVTYRPTNIHFLGYYNNSGMPVKAIDTIIASTIYPERTVTNKVETVSRMIGQAYSCFEPTHAHSFFMAAKLLAEEEQMARGDLEEFIMEHPYKFKYLMTIGIDPRKIVFHDPEPNIPSLITLPGANLKRWVPRMYDLDQLYTEGVIHFYDEEHIAEVDNNVMSYWRE